MPYEPIGRALVMVGLVIVLLGLVVVLVGRLGGWPRLPGDLVIQRPGLTVYLPIGTSIALSLLLTLIMLAASYFRR